MFNTSEEHSKSIFGIVETWVIMIPLVYFALGGILWFENQGESRAPVSTSLLSGSSRTIASSAVFMAIYVILFLLTVSRIKSVWNICRVNIVFVLLALLAFASVIWSQVPMKTIEWSICLMANTWFAFYLYGRFSAAQQIQLFYALGWICLIASVVLSALFPMYGTSLEDGSVAWKGIYDHKNACSMMTLFLLPAALYVPATGIYRNIFRFVYLVLSMFLILMTHSATGRITLGCFVVYVAVWHIIRRFVSKDRVIVLLLFTAFGLSLIAGAVFYFKEIAYLLGKDPTLTGRTQIWISVLAQISDHPILGYGYKSFWLGAQGASTGISLTRGWFVKGAHNDLLEVWLELGAVGLCLFLYSTIMAFRNLITSYRHANFSIIAWYVCLLFLIIFTTIDESGVIASANHLSWMLYILACVGLSGEARWVKLRLRPNNSNGISDKEF